MADITLRRNVFGDGYSGSISVPAGLSWMDSMAIQSAAHSAWQTSAETRRARQALEQIDYDVERIGDSIAALESSIGLKLDAQTQVLEQQSQAVEKIRGAVLNPAKTRAAERAADAAQLLRNERYERALKVSEEGIDADPNNPLVFFSAGWALVGLERFDEAGRMFEEARDASRGDQRSLAARQAARAAFLSGKKEAAYELARDARQDSESPDEAAAVAYDVAVYAWATGDQPTARESIERACQRDSRHAERAMADVAFEDAQEIRDVAANVLSDLGDDIASRRVHVGEHLEKVRAAFPGPPRADRPHSELGGHLRPQSDWKMLRAQIDARISQTERALTEVHRLPRFQDTLATLKTAEQTLGEIEQQRIPELRANISAHDAAAGRHDELQSTRKRAALLRDRWATAETQAHRITRSSRRWFFWGFVLLIAGAFVHPLLAVGVVVVGIAVIALLLVGVARDAREQRDDELTRLDKEIHG